MKDTKALILKVAIELFRHDGFDNVSVDMICEKCGISKGAFYHHFKAKSNLLTEYLATVVPHHLSLINDIIDISDPVEQLWTLIMIYIENSRVLGPDLVKHMWISDIAAGNELLTPFVIYSDGPLSGLNELIRKVIISSQKTGHIDDAVSADDLLFAFTSALMGLCATWAAKGGGFDYGGELRRIFNAIFRVSNTAESKLPSVSGQ